MSVRSRKSAKLLRYWSRKSVFIENPRLSIANKILAYKVFLRPLLLFQWYERRGSSLKDLEITTLRRILGDNNAAELYDLFTDVDLLNYIRVEQIRWRRATGLHTSHVRRLLSGDHGNSTARYFVRAIECGEKSQDMEDSSTNL